MSATAPLAGLYKARLARLLLLSYRYEDDVNEDGRRMLDLCIKATVRDCEDAGVSRGAIAALEHEARRSAGRTD